MRFFRSFRVQSMDSNNIKKYFRYAMGEIILVVVGILIAFQINNYGDRLKQQTRLSSIVHIVQEDLANDTAEASEVIRWYKERQVFFKLLLQDSFSLEQIDTSTIIRGLIMSFQPFTMDQMGYQLLRKQENIVNLQKDKAMIETIHFYSESIKQLEITEGMVRSDVNSNILYYRDNFHWFYELLSSSNVKEYAKHVKDDPGFKNKLVNHYVLVYNNFIPTLMTFKNEAAIILNKLEQFNE